MVVVMFRGDAMRCRLLLLWAIDGRGSVTQAALLLLESGEVVKRDGSLNLEPLMIEDGNRSYLRNPMAGMSSARS